MNILGIHMTTRRRHDEELRSLAQARTDHAAERHRADLMSTMLAAGMIQGRLVTRRRLDDRIQMSIPGALVKTMSEGGAWTISTRKDPENNTIDVVLDRRPKGNK